MEKQRKRFGTMYRLETEDPEKYAKLKSDYYGKSLTFLKYHYPEYFTGGRSTLPNILYREFWKRNYKHNGYNYPYEKQPKTGCKAVDLYWPDGMLTPGSAFGPKVSEKESNYYDDPSFEVVQFYKPMKNPT